MIAEALALLAPYAPEIEELVAALEAGADRDVIMVAIRSAMAAASDAAMKKELG